MNGTVAFTTKEILLIEDSSTDSLMVKRTLEKTGLKNKVVTMTDGDKAMDYLRRPGAERMPDLILLDLNLPKKDGWEVLRECKSDPVLRFIPVVVFTTSQLGSEVRRCYELGANSFVAKPFELGAFTAAIQQIESYWLRISSPVSG